MTSGVVAQAAPFTTGTPVVDLHACLDSLGSFDVDGLGAEQLGGLLDAVTRAESRLAAFRLRVIGAADRKKAAWKTGAASTGAWAASVSRTDQGDAQRQVGLAKGLERRTATASALGEGLISADNAAVIVKTDRELPAQITTDQRAAVEAVLIEKAQTLPPKLLRAAARRAIEAFEADQTAVDAHENTLVASEEEIARAKTKLTMHETSDGMLAGSFLIPAFHGGLLAKVIQTITAPRRGRLGASYAQAGDGASRTDWDRARGQALCELIEHLPTDHLHPKTAATVVVTIDHEALNEKLKVAGLDTGNSLSAGEARRIACGAGIIPAVLGGQSQVLDLGRSNRLFSDPQRVAVGLKHTTCAAEGCERPFSWCELHHHRPWSQGGKTDLDQAVPLCHFHHQRIHDRSYEHRRMPDGSITFHAINVAA